MNKLIFLIVNFFILLFTTTLKSKEFQCLISKTEPYVDLNLLPSKGGVLTIDFINKKVKSWYPEIKIENLIFNEDKVTWYHRFNNPFTDKPRITFSYFLIKTGEFIQNTYSDKDNLTKEDLVLVLIANCK